MFDVGGGELVVIGIVALLVVGPKELPGLLRTAGAAMNKVRRMAGEFRTQFDDAMREAEVDQAKKAFSDMDDVAKSAKAGFNPLESIRNEIQSAKEDLKGVTHSRDVQVAADVPAAAPETQINVPLPAAPLNLVGLDPPAKVEPAAPVEPPAAKPKRVRKAKADDAGTAS
jgi:sec-independent protein translocase protein TatB